MGVSRSSPTSRCCQRVTLFLHHGLVKEVLIILLLVSPSSPTLRCCQRVTLFLHQGLVKEVLIILLLVSQEPRNMRLRILGPLQKYPPIERSPLPPSFIPTTKRYGTLQSGPSTEIPPYERSPPPQLCMPN